MFQNRQRPTHSPHGTYHDHEMEVQEYVDEDNNIMMNYMHDNSRRTYSNNGSINEMQEHIHPQNNNNDDDKYLYERDAINDAQSVAYTAYTMDQQKDIVKQLRNVGVTVLSLESLSTAAMINYMDAVTTMRLGNGNDEKCMLYTDRMGRVFNVVISGGAKGLNNTWSITQSSFSGWISIATLPFLVRNALSYSFDGYVNGSPMALDPIFLMLLFGFILKHETSHSILGISLLVRGTNSVGSYVWRSGSLTDYPRLILLIILLLACVASPMYPIRDILSLSGTIIGIILLLCNLGCRAWNKVDIGFIDASNFFTPTLTVLASLLAGLLFPYVGLRFVDGGTTSEDGQTDVEKIIFNPNGKRARQNVTVAASFVAFIYLLSDVKVVQDVLQFEFVMHRGVTNVGVGVWWLLSTIISMSMCHHLDSSKSKKIEPFLRRDETSPVGWVVPSVPHIVIDPNLARGKMVLSFLSFGSDLLCVVIAVGLAFLMIWTGIKDFQGKDHTAFWVWN